jgi:RNA polymerase sigma-70 factor (ECF subfamily)
VRRIVDEHEDRLLRYAGRLLGDADRARDVVQEAFLKLCRQSPAELDGKLTPWLYTVTRNRCVDLLRKEHPMSSLTQAQPAAPPGSGGPGVCVDPLEAVERDESASLAQRALGDLPPNQQEVVRLKFEQGLSYKQIAEVTGLTVTNVGYLLHTALKTLRGVMEQAASPKPIHAVTTASTSEGRLSQ